ncbi:MAG TPA: hypothetical protein VJA40_03060, partial [archaeon]|nr:hypothetical protein [archaeon]
TDTASVRVHVTPPGADTGIILPAIGFDAMTAVQVVLLFLAVASYLFFKNLKRVKPPRKPKPRPKPSRTRKSGPRRGKKRL